MSSMTDTYTTARIIETATAEQFKGFTNQEVEYIAMKYEEQITALRKHIKEQDERFFEQGEAQFRKAFQIWLENGMVLFTENEALKAEIIKLKSVNVKLIQKMKTVNL